MNFKHIILFLLLLNGAAFAIEETAQYTATEEISGQETEQNKKETSVQIEKNSTERENLNGFYPAKYQKVKYKAYISPKAEQKKTENMAVKNLEKRKTEFQKRKNTELEFLQKEYNILNYTP